MCRCNPSGTRVATIVFLFDTNFHDRRPGSGCHLQSEGRELRDPRTLWVSQPRNNTGAKRKRTASPGRPRRPKGSRSADKTSGNGRRSVESWRDETKLSTALQGCRFSCNGISLLCCSEPPTSRNPMPLQGLLSVDVHQAVVHITQRFVTTWQSGWGLVGPQDTPIRLLWRPTVMQCADIEPLPHPFRSASFNRNFSALPEILRAWGVPLGAGSLGDVRTSMDVASIPTTATTNAELNGVRRRCQLCVE